MTSPSGLSGCVSASLLAGLEAGRPAAVPERWWEQAACAGLDPHMFDDASPRARAVCRGCLVRVACARDQLAWEEAYKVRRRTRVGMFGGFTPYERAAASRRARGVA
ncbi:WhiB family transcriptional regulator [Streptoalloteichus tenebrarius]|nr:WhiB family transcriptional regulator [Streptoalloteichus tenebrarius]